MTEKIERCSPDLDQSGKLSAWLQSKLVVPLLTSFTASEKKREKTRQKLVKYWPPVFRQNNPYK